LAWYASLGHSAMPSRCALILANGAYTQKPKLSRPAAAAAELAKKLGAMGFEVESAVDQTLAGMKDAVEAFLRLVSLTAPQENGRQDGQEETPLLFCTFCGHGSAGRFLPIDAARSPSPQESFCFFEDLLFKLFQTLGSDFNYRVARQDFVRKHCRHAGFSASFEEEPEVIWACPGARIFIVIESCRRLFGEELAAFEAAKARAAYGKRHLLPCMQALRPDVATMGGADWDAARMAALSRQIQGPGAPQLLIALSSESTTRSYDVVFLRSIIDSIDKPVRLGGILERAALDTLRRTGHQQKPVILYLGGDCLENLQDCVLASRPGPGSGLRRGGALLRSKSLPALTRSCATSLEPRNSRFFTQKFS